MNSASDHGFEVYKNMLRFEGINQLKLEPLLLGAPNPLY